MAAHVPQGKYIARAKAWGFGVAGTGTEQIGVSFEITEGDYAGKRVGWYGFFNSEENAKRAMRSMRTCGWDGQGPVTEADGLDTNDVEIVVEEDSYQGETKSKVAWVNAIGVALKPMSEEQQQALNARLSRWQKPSTGARARSATSTRSAPMAASAARTTKREGAYDPGPPDASVANAIDPADDIPF